MHEIVTWWKKTERLGALCYCIEFDDKEFTEITSINDDTITRRDGLGGVEVVKIENWRTYSVATLVWDR